MRLSKSFAAVLLLLAVPGWGQDWSYYGFDPGGSRFSPLTQIDRDNVNQLELAWSFRHGDLARNPDRKRFAAFHATPILVPESAGRSLIFCTPFHRVIALNPGTGEQRWSFDPKVSYGLFPTRLKCLGVAYWHDQQAPGNAACAHRIYVGTSDRRLIALDARSGQVCKDFGVNGQVDVNPLIKATSPVPENLWGIVFAAPPVVIGGVVVIGGINNMKNQYASAANGSIRAFDGRTGALRWTFDPIPHDPGDPEFDRWEPDSLAKTGGANVWSLLSVDQDRDLVFLPTASASPNFYGGTRPGDNPYANSLVALRGSTGEVVWHFQLIHHDVWDWDLPAQPILVDITRDGERIPVVVQLTKSSMVFVFHRETGEPFFPVEERPVPTDGVSGEVLSPTQPFPAKPPLLMKTGIKPGDAWGMNFYERGRCRKLIAGARYGDIFTPPSAEGLIMFPGTGGGMNWGGGAYDPDRNLLITSVSQLGMWFELMPASDADLNAPFDPSVGAPMGPKAPIRGTPYALKQGILLSPTFMPCTVPPWSSLVGVDLAAGEISWSVPLGVIDKMARMPLPMKWGTPTAGGPIITASGLVLVGSTADRRMRAFDVDNGDELWVTELPSSAHATPMTYEVAGRQFVVIAAGGHMFINANEIDDYLLAYALPQ